MLDCCWVEAGRCPAPLSPPMVLWRPRLWFAILPLLNEESKDRSPHSSLPGSRGLRLGLRGECGRRGEAEGERRGWPAAQAGQEEPEGLRGLS